MHITFGNGPMRNTKEVALADQRDIAKSGIFTLNSVEVCVITTVEEAD